MENSNREKLFPHIENSINSLALNTISDARKKMLLPLVDFIQSKVNENKEIRINFICTHNSRRSHLSQVWAQALAGYYGISKITCYSGGSETTAMHQMTVDTIKSHGFQVHSLYEAENPVYIIKYAPNAHPLIGFSKVYGDLFNPQTHFAAVLTCSQADAACPFIPGAEKRISIPYNDPKTVDNSPQQVNKYKECSLQIASELAFVFSQIKN